MEVKTIVRFTDKAEAARWLAKYYLEAGSMPKAFTEVLHAEFPYDHTKDVNNKVIEREAIRLITACEPLCQNKAVHPYGWPATTEREHQPMCRICVGLYDQGECGKALGEVES